MTAALALPEPDSSSKNPIRRRGVGTGRGKRVAATPRVDTLERRQNAYLKGVMRDGTLMTGCRTAHVSPDTVYVWRNDPEFVAKERAAREAMADSLEAEAIRRGTRGVQQPVYQAGKLVGYRTEYSDALLVLVLKAARPERYRERIDLQVPQIIKAIGGVDPTDVL